MESLSSEWIIIAINAIIIALIITAPLLVGILVIRVIRKGVSEDRRTFEDEVKAELAEIKKQLEDLSQG
jgi:hypothetical protein